MSTIHRMKNPCHAIAAAKHKPRNFLLRDSQRPSGPGQRICTDEAAKARSNQGTAQRTEAWIIAETAGPLERSDRSIPMIIANEIGPLIIQNRLHPLTAVLFRTLFIPMPQHVATSKTTTKGP